MGLAEWIRTFRELHEKARRGPLVPHEETAYRAGRDELARALVAAQRLTLQPGQTPREGLRVARALQVDLDLVTSSARAITVDLSISGFSCLLGKAPPVGDEVKYTLRIPSSEPLAGTAKVTDVKAQQGNVRVSFLLVGLEPKDAQRLETFVFDTVLAQLAG